MSKIMRLMSKSLTLGSNQISWNDLFHASPGDKWVTWLVNPWLAAGRAPSDMEESYSIQDPVVSARQKLGAFERMCGFIAPVSLLYCLPPHEEFLWEISWCCALSAETLPNFGGAPGGAKFSISRCIGNLAFCEMPFTEASSRFSVPCDLNKSSA